MAARIVGAAVIAMVWGVVAAQCVRVLDVRREVMRAGDGLARAESEADELVRLRARSAVRVLGAAPEAAFVASVERAAGEAGLEPGITRSIRRRGERRSGDGVGRVREMQIEMGAMPLARLGAFLGAWRALEPAWVVRAVRLRHAAGAGDGSGWYEVSLTCSAEYAGGGS